MEINSLCADGDRIYASNNEYGIPTLLLDCQPEKSILLPVCLWGHRGRLTSNITTYLFYLEDDNFTGLIRNFKKIVRSGCEEVAELNLTVNDVTPPAIAIERIYQKRWVSRSLQECGLKVWVDLNVSRRYADLNLYGVPKGYNAFITRGYADRIEDLFFEYEIARKVSGKDIPNFVVYGGGKMAEKFCIEHNSIYLQDIMTIRHDIIHKKKGGVDD